MKLKGIRFVETAIVAAASVLTVVAGIARAAPEQRPQAVVAVREIVQTARFDCTAVAPYGTRQALTPASEVTVGKVFATAGQYVRRGQTLLMISDPASRNAYQRTSAALRQARERLERVQAQYRLYLENAAARVQSARRMVAEARSALERARVAVTVYDSAPIASAPAETVDGKGMVAGSHRGPTRVVVRHRSDPHAVAAASASLTAARNELNAAERGYADARIHVRKSVAPYERHRDQAYSAFRKAQRDRREDQVKTTLSGTVTSIAEPGEAVAKGQAMAEVVQLDRLVAVVLEPQASLRAVRVGQRIVLDMEEQGALPAVIADKKDVGDQTKVTIGFDNVARQVKPGTRGTAVIRTAHAQAVAAVPVDALRADGTVTVLRGGQWQAAAVETGISDGHWIAVKRGLRPGEKVALPRQR